MSEASGEFRYSAECLEYETVRHGRQFSSKLAWDFGGLRQKLLEAGFEAASLDALQPGLTLRLFSSRVVLLADARNSLSRGQAESSESVERVLAGELAWHLRHHASLAESLDEHGAELAEKAREEFAGWLEETLRSAVQGLLKHLPLERWRLETGCRERLEFCLVHFVLRLRLLLRLVLVPADALKAEKAVLPDSEKDAFHQQLLQALDALAGGVQGPEQAAALAELRAKAADPSYFEQCKAEARSPELLARLAALHHGLLEALDREETDQPDCRPPCRDWWSQPFQPKQRVLASALFGCLKEALQADIEEKYRVMDCDGRPLLRKTEELWDKHYVETRDFGLLVYSTDQDRQDKRVKLDWFPLAEPGALRSEAVPGSLIRNSVHLEKAAVFVMVELSTGDPAAPDQDLEHRLYLIDEALLRENQQDAAVQLFSRVVWSKKATQARQEIELLLTAVSGDLLAVVQNSGVIDLLNRNLDYPVHLKADLADLRAAHAAPPHRFDLLEKMKETAPEQAGYRGSFVYRSYLHRGRLILLCSDAYDSHLDQKTNRIASFKVKNNELVYRSQHLLPKLKKDDWYFPVYLAKLRHAAVMVVVSGTKGYRLVSIWRDRFLCVAKNDLPLSFEVPEGCRGFEKSGHVRSDWAERGRRINVVLTEPKDAVHNPDCFLMELKLKL